MGNTFNNFHIHNTPASAVIEALQTRTAKPAFVTDAVGGWVSVYLGERFSSDAESLAQSLSSELATATMYLWEYDSDACGYTLFVNGEERDVFDSAPDMWAGEDGEDGEPIPVKTPEEREQLRGKPEDLLPYCRPGATIADIAAALSQTASDGIDRLATALGTPEGDSSFRDEFLAKVEASMTAIRNSGLPVDGLLPARAVDSYLTSLDADTILADLSRVLGIDGFRYGINFNDIDDASVDIPVTRIDPTSSR